MGKPYDPTGKVVVITGAAGGIGSALASRFANAGCKLALMDIAEGPLAQLAEYLSHDGTEVFTRVNDVTDEADCKAAVADVVARFGAIDVLINNAGRTHLSFFAETEVRVLRQIMEINHFGAVHWTHHALHPLEKNGGAVVAISSIAGVGPLAGRCGYSASKHAMYGFFESIRGELKPLGIRVMSVCPMFVTNTGIGASAFSGTGGAVTKDRTQTGKTITPDMLADDIFHGLVRGKDRLFPTSTARLAFVLSRVAPKFYEKKMLKNLVG